MPRAAFVSFRFGTTDGVSAVTRHWRTAFESIGYQTVSVAAEGADRLVPGLAMQPAPALSPGEMERTLDDCDLVVIENLCTIPLNLAAAFAMAQARAGLATVLHHHDPAWQRERFAHITELPPTDPAWRHVTINRTTEREMVERGIPARTIFNGFPPGGRGDRAAMRTALDVRDDEILVAHPVRAIERKNIPKALEICTRLGATYWLLGPAEDGYDETLERLLVDAPVRVIRRSCSVTDDIYAAADLVVYPSVFEGFGNPPIEASLRRRGVVIGDYPMARELAALGFRFFSPDDIGGMRAHLDAPAPDVLDTNEHLANLHFSLDRMTADIAGLLADAGWLP